MVKGLSSGSRVFQYITIDRHTSLQKGGLTLEAVNGTVEFRDVCFSYPSRPKQVNNFKTEKLFNGRHLLDMFDGSDSVLLVKHENVLQDILLTREVAYIATAVVSRRDVLLCHLYSLTSICVHVHCTEAFVTM